MSEDNSILESRITLLEKEVTDLKDKLNAVHTVVLGTQNLIIKALPKKKE